MHIPSSLPLIRSKLYPPRNQNQHVVRDRVLRQLSVRSQRALTLVCAPAGSGKSTLLSNWLASTDTLYGWVSLDERDNELDTFLGYVLAAVGAAFPGISLDTRGLLSAAIPPTLAAIASSLSNDLDRLDAEFLLVLDDYHVISNPHIHELLLQVMQHPPAMLRLLVATRSDPPWPLATLRARGRLAELRYPELQFTRGESAMLLQTALGYELDGDVVTTLHLESEGWAAGLHLMALVLQGEDPTRPLLLQVPAVREDIGSYLLAEVLSKQTPNDQDRLLQMSILGRFSASLCESVCTPDGEQHAMGSGLDRWGGEFLARLNQDNLFVVSLDPHHEFYRFHQLFRQFLGTQLRERYSNEVIAGLHRRASDWFAERGFIEEALDHALAAGDTVAAAQLVARHRGTLYNHEQFARLARWLRLLPAEVKEHNPELLLAEARIATMNWRYTEASVFLDRAEHELAKRSPEHPNIEAVRGELATLRGILQFWDGDTERFLASSRYALEVLPRDASHLRGLAHTGIGFGLYLRGDAPSAWTYLENQLANESPQLPVYAWLLQTKGFLHWLDGDLSNLHAAAMRLSRVCEDLDLPDLQATAQYYLGVAHYARNELAAAQHHLERAVGARYTMRLMWWCQAAGMLGLTYLIRGQPAQAQQMLDGAHAFLLDQRAMRIVPNIGAFQAELHRLQGRWVEANAWAARVDPLPMTSSLAVVDPRLIQVKVLLSQERATSLDQASQVLADLRAYCKHVSHRRLLMEIETLEALEQGQRGQTERALKTLERAVLSAEADGWVRLFVDMGPAMKSLLAQLAARGVAPHYLAHILAAFPVATTTPAPALHERQEQLIEPLSERELEVLSLLSQRYSNKEIAARLFIAPTTVKHHTIKIYRKLNAADRREAVSLAEAMGLLSIHA